MRGKNFKTGGGIENTVEDNEMEIGCIDVWEVEPKPVSEIVRILHANPYSWLEPIIVHFRLPVGFVEPACRRKLQ